MVLDFEATCQEGDKKFKQEIIEFPIVLVDLEKKQINDKFFHYYIKPVENPKLTDFCKDLTKIKQE